MIAIYCETPFQLIVALNVAFELLEEQEKIDLYIVKDMYNSTNQFLLHTTHNCINHIFYVHRKLPHRSIYTRIKQRIIYRRDRVLHIYLDTNNIKHFPEYKAIITIKYNNILKYMCKHLAKDGKIYFTEEGVGEYLCGNENKIIEKQRIHKYVGGRYLLLPELALDKKTVQIYRNPYLNQGEEFQKLLKSFFEYDKEINLYSKFIFFDQPYKKDYNYDEYDIITNDIFKELKELFCIDEICIKAHPRTEKTQSEIKTIYGTCPWECLVYHMEDVGERVLLSLTSTAVITPKILCNKEPYVIILIYFMRSFYEQIENGSTIFERNLSLFKYVQSRYEKDKFFIPTTVEEYKSILKKINENAFAS